MMRLACLYGSSRRNGNSELLAERVLHELDVTRFHLTDWHIDHIVDRRHDPDGFPPLDGPAARLYTEVLAHDALMFVTPVYWYGMSGLMKDFVDRWSQLMRDKRYDFRRAMKDKEGYVVITGGDSPRYKALPLVRQFNLIFDYMGMKFSDYIIGDADKPGEILGDQQALADAARLNEKLRARLLGERPQAAGR